MITNIATVVTTTPDLTDGHFDPNEILAEIQAQIAEEWQTRWEAQMCARSALLREYIPKKYKGKSFDDFDRDAQAHAYDVAQQYAADVISGDISESDAESLILIGTTGTGKTHLAAAICNAVLDANIAAIFGAWDDHIDRIKSDFYSDDNDDYLDKIKSASLLIIDDLYDYDAGSWEQKTLFKIINSRTADGLPTVITTNLTPAQLTASFGDRIVSRLMGACRAVKMIGRDYRKRSIS